MSDGRHDSEREAHCVPCNRLAESARELVRQALSDDVGARAVAAMRCDGNAAGMCARAEMAQALEMYDHAIAALRAARSSLATLQLGHTRCERCKWGD